MKRSRIALAAVMVALVGATGTPAGSDRSTGMRDWAHALALQRDGKAVAVGLSEQTGGSSSRPTYQSSFALARYTARGRLDRAFGRNGKQLARIGSYGASEVAIQRDGKLLVAGYPILVRYRTDGTVDAAFGHGGRVPASGPFALQPDGKIIVVGRTGRHSVLTRYDARGRVDRTFGHAGHASIAAAEDVVLQSDRKIVIASSFLGRGFRFIVVARYNADGTADSSFGKGGKVLIDFGCCSRLGAIAIQADGKIVAAGGRRFEDFALVRLTPDGALDPDFGEGGRVSTDFTRASNCDGCPTSVDEAHAVAVQPDGKIVAAGVSDTQRRCDSRGHSCGDFALARYQSDGTLDKSFGSGGKVVTHFDAESPVPSSSIAESLVIQRDGKLVVAGLGAGYDFGLARYTPRGRLDPTFGHAGKVLTDFSPG